MDKNQQIQFVTKLIQDSTDKDFITNIGSVTAKGATIDLDIGKIAKEKGVDAKNMNILFG